MNGIEENKKLIKKYPFLLPRNRFTDEPSKDYDYTYTEWDALEEGWDIAFGDILLEEIGEALEKDNLLDNFRIDQIKEKYGGLRFYHRGGNKEVSDIINKYEVVSQFICIECGKPDVASTYKGWIYPICEKCWNKSHYHKNMPYEDHVDMKYSKMPDEMKYTTFSNGEIKKVTIDISETVNKIRENWEVRNGTTSK